MSISIVDVKSLTVAPAALGTLCYGYMGEANWHLAKRINLGVKVEQMEGKIMDEKNKSMSSSGGDDTPINEVEILERTLGQRRGHIRGVGRTVKSVTPDVALCMLYTPHNQDWHDELRQANARWQEQQEINIRMQQQINELMSRQKAFVNSFKNTYKPTFEEEEDDDDDDDESE
ncbi:hypothetical protein R6Q59_036021 [Mikania micrantha]